MEMVEDVKIQVDALQWLTNGPIPPHICTNEDLLFDIGFYRYAPGSDGHEYDFYSFCQVEIKDFILIHIDDFHKMMDGYLPEE